MEALIVCRCTHSINTHENGGCSVARCGCKLASYSVLDDEIDRIKRENGMRLRPALAAGRT